MVLFKRTHIKMILQGRKTQTRRTHKRTWKLGKTYPVQDRWFGKALAYIKITRKFREKLGDISREDIVKEGYNSLEELKKVWEEEINGPGSWDPKQIVTVYEFKYVGR